MKETIQIKSDQSLTVAQAAQLAKKGYKYKGHSATGGTTTTTFERDGNK